MHFATQKGKETHEWIKDLININWYMYIGRSELKWCAQLGPLKESWNLQSSLLPL